MAEHSWNPSTQVTLEDRKENQPELKRELAGPFEGRAKAVPKVFILSGCPRGTKLTD